MDSRHPPERVAWAAGILDGEGCLILAKGKQSSRHNEGRVVYFVMVHVSNTDPRILLALKNMFGGRVYPANPPIARYANYQPAWQWVVRSRKAVEALAEVEPYLVSKREQAILLLDYYARCKGRRLTPDAITENDELRNTLSYLKRHKAPLAALVAEAS